MLGTRRALIVAPRNRRLFARKAGMPPRGLGYTAARQRRKVASVVKGTRSETPATWRVIAVAAIIAGILAGAILLPPLDHVSNSRNGVVGVASETR
jgi:hypothetical protein